jgi:1-acyl-sn-glycerol-3-phosphate acyltransferase
MSEIQGVRRRDAFHVRLCGTALSFAVFGLGGFLLGALVFPILRLLPSDRQTKRTRARAIIRRSMRYFVEFMRVLGVLTYDFRGVDGLGRPGQLIVANHPSLIDVVFLLAFTHNAGCVVKHGLWRNPLTRGPVSAAGYCSNLSTEGMVSAAVDALAGGQCLIMFPEGTRTRPGEPMALHRGAANVALKAARVVTPVFIRVSPTTLTKAEPWYRIPTCRPHFSLEVGKDLDLGEFRDTGQIPVVSRTFNDRMREIFEMELAGGGV